MIVLDLRKIANVKNLLSKMTSLRYSKAVVIILLIALAVGVGGYKLVSRANPAATTNNTTVADAAVQPAPQASDPSASPANNPPTNTYVVKPGDTLWSIARAYNTTVDQIKALNNLTTDNLSLDQKLVVAGTAPAASTSTNTSTSASAKTNSSSKANTQVASRSSNTTLSGSVLSKAAQYLHTPYVWGGTSPRGFDCSGFVQYVYRQYGYSLPRTADAQAAAGRSVARKDLKPGDLVYFASGGSINHIGIYVGNGKFIHSSSPRSGGVIYSSLSEDYYAARYAGATRILR